MQKLCIKSTNRRLLGWPGKRRHLNLKQRVAESKRTLAHCRSHFEKYQILRVIDANLITGLHGIMIISSQFLLIHTFAMFLIHIIIGYSWKFTLSTFKITEVLFQHSKIQSLKCFILTASWYVATSKIYLLFNYNKCNVTCESKIY